MTVYTLDEIVKNNVDYILGSKLRLLKEKGFDFDISVVIEPGDYNHSYGRSEIPQIYNIMLELMDNAFKAIYGVGDLCDREEDIEKLKTIKGRIEVKLAEAGPNYIISIKDNGAGIPDENKLRIFEPGFSTRGTEGMGLREVREKVNSLGGSVDYVSEPGRGTTFSIRLPKLYKV